MYLFHANTAFIARVGWVVFGGLLLSSEGARSEEESILNLTARDGLRGDSVSSLQRDYDGNLWFISGGEIQRYDGSEFTSWPARIGFPSNDSCKKMRRDSLGVMWIASERNRLYRFDGRALTNVFSASGESLASLHLDSDRSVWFGIAARALCHYDGVSFVEYGPKEGLPAAQNYEVVRTQDGQLWVGIACGDPPDGGLFRLDRGRFKNVGREHGLGDPAVRAIGALVHGGFWAATDHGMVYHDGVRFRRFTTADGLPHDRVTCGFIRSDGGFWCGTESGVAQFDGVAWASLDSRDGLAGSVIHGIAEDDERDVWFATDAGLTRYRRNPAAPVARIRAVETDRSYEHPGTLPAFKAHTRIRIKIECAEIKTGNRQFRCRIAPGVRTSQELDSGPDSPENHHWLPPSREAQFDWTPSKSGKYTFAVQAIDHDLMYSRPAVLVFTILPPWYLSPTFITVAAGAVFVVCIFSVLQTSNQICKRS